VMRQLGQRRAKVFNEQYSYGADTVRDGVSFSKAEEDQYLVNYSDIQSLPDLHCYITLPGDYPVVRMNMRYEKMPFIAQGIIPREVDDSLDPEVEAEIDLREREHDGVSRLLNQVMNEGEETTPAANPDGTTRPAFSSAAVARQAQAVAATVTAAVATTAPSAATAPAKPAPAPTAAASNTITTDNGGSMVERDGILIDTQTGEIIPDGGEYEDYAQYQQEAMRAMREEEKNILHHDRDEGKEPGEMW